MNLRIPPRHRLLARRVAAACLTVVALAALPACGKRDQSRRDLLEAIARTKDLTYRFVYADEKPALSTPMGDIPGRSVEVRGFTEDDFRVAGRVAVDGKVTYDEVVNDDALAMRFYDPGRLREAVDPELEGLADQATELSGITSLDVLRSKRWLLDPKGAPRFTTVAGAEARIGTDPLRDALGALDYVEQAVAGAIDVEMYNEDDLTPVFRSSEDVFPKPDDKAGVVRYDLRRPDLPQIASAGNAGGGAQETLATRHFRKMVVYVKDGVVIRVLERVEVIGAAVDDLIDYQRRVFKEVDLAQEISDAFEELVAADLPPEQKGYLLLGFINVGLESQGLTPLLVRNMSLDLVDHGSFNEVALPPLGAGDVIKGSLEVLRSSGYRHDGAGETAEAPADAASPPADGTAPVPDAAEDGPPAADAG